MKYVRKIWGSLQRREFVDRLRSADEQPSLLAFLLIPVVLMFHMIMWAIHKTLIALMGNGDD